MGFADTHLSQHMGISAAGTFPLQFAGARVSVPWQLPEDVRSTLPGPKSRSFSGQALQDDEGTPGQGHLLPHLWRPGHRAGQVDRQQLTTGGLFGGSVTTSELL